jgi:hypothetical protein
MPTVAPQKVNMGDLASGEARLRELAAVQHGLVAVRQAKSCGLESWQTNRLAESARWERATSRVLGLIGAPPTGGEWAMVAVLDVGRDSVLSHAAAGRWWGLPGFESETAEVVTVVPSRRTSAVSLVHRVRRLPPGLVTSHCGVPIVRPELLILQLCGSEHPDRAARALDNAWSRRLLSGPSLTRVLAEYGERGRNGSGVLRQLLDLRGADYVPPASNLEARALEVLGAMGVTWRLQVDSGGESWTGRVDLRAEELPLIVEIQSGRYHSALLDQIADDARMRQLREAGFVVVEVTDDEVWRARDVARGRVAAGIMEARRRRSAGQL